jgi:Ca-activated chloride channel homolog
MKRAVICLSILWATCVIAGSVRAQTTPPEAPQEPSTLQSLGPPPPLPTPKPKPSVAPTPEPEVEVQDNDIVRVSTDLITVPAEVMDRTGRYIGNLRKDDFRIFENGVEQELAYFASVEQPFTVALLLDVSGSTQSQLQAIRTAANAFIQGLRPNDRLLLISFDGKINVLTEAVTLAELRKKKLRLDALNDGTLLYETIDFVLNQRLAGIQGRKAVVLLTDGVDGGSRKALFKKNIRDATEANATIYTVRYNTLPQLPQRLSQIANPKARAHVEERMRKEYLVAANYLQSLTDKTGGRLYNADSLVEVPQMFQTITDELGRQYSLGYYPKGHANPGDKRDIRVRLRLSNLVVKARESYTVSASSLRAAGQD